jgi:hypothetical protein
MKQLTNLSNTYKYLKIIFKQRQGVFPHEEIPIIKSSLLRAGYITHIRFTQ